MEVVRNALDIAKKGRADILETIVSILPNPRESLKPDAPRIKKHQIDVDKIGLLIGPGGKTIKGISEESGAVIDINDDGIINVMDVISTVNIALGILELNPCVDMNDDGLINVLDILNIVSIILGS